MSSEGGIIIKPSIANVAFAFMLAGMSLFSGYAALAQSTKAASEPIAAKRNDAKDVSNDSAKPVLHSDVPTDIDSQRKDQTDSSATKSEGGKEQNLPNLRALVNIIANGIEILCLAWGIPICLLVPVGLVVVWMKGKRWWGAAMIVFGPLMVIVGLAAPGVINILLEALISAGK